MSDSISAAIFTFGRGVNRLLPLQFQFDEHNHQLLVHENVLNEIINILQQQFNTVMAVAGNQDITKRLCK